MQRAKTRLYVVTFFNTENERDWDITTSNAPIAEVEDDFKQAYEAEWETEITEVDAFPQDKVDGWEIHLKRPARLPKKDKEKVAV